LPMSHLLMSHLLMSHLLMRYRLWKKLQPKKLGRLPPKNPKRLVHTDPDPECLIKAIHHPKKKKKKSSI
ncbi:MAG: hypothetical protein ACO3SO_12150, partial [Luteolibacter sp.]